MGIVGAGPVGLTLALELARRGVPSTVLDAGERGCVGSRAIALHRSALTTWEPLGVTSFIVGGGVAWRVRRTFYREAEVHTLILPEPAPGELPLWTNYPQSALETLLLDAAEASELIELCWRCRVVGLGVDDASVTLAVDTGDPSLRTCNFRYVVAADGCRSTMREAMRLPFPGASYPDQFLITDVRAAVDWPAEPRFHFDHPCHPGSTVLIHPQPSNIWRVDWQLGRGIDPEVIDTLARVKLDQLFGSIPYRLVWSSVYRFHQRLLPQLHYPTTRPRVFFAGDAAHLVAPFGARGLNSGIADVACLAPRLARVITGDMSPEILRSYTTQRIPALLRDQRDVTATMRFMTPQNRVDRARQRTVLHLATRWPRARGWINSGRMYQP